MFCGLFGLYKEGLWYTIVPNKVKTSGNHLDFMPKRSFFRVDLAKRLLNQSCTFQFKYSPVCVLGLALRHFSGGGGPSNDL